uniref:Uncharacterized protein n=1 Tax=Timema poppense TaxID=170557 RepID=A0A7R9CQV2_TIMPO|nr:unnamed protein product [Timema poppensis]
MNDGTGNILALPPRPSNDKSPSGNNSQSRTEPVPAKKSRMKASVLLFVVACVFLPEGTQGEDYPDPVALTNKANEENLTNILKCFYSEGECPKGTVELKAVKWLAGEGAGRTSPAIRPLAQFDTEPLRIDNNPYSNVVTIDPVRPPPSKKIWTKEDESKDKSIELEPTPFLRNHVLTAAHLRPRLKLQGQPEQALQVNDVNYAIVTEMIQSAGTVLDHLEASFEIAIFPTVAVSACSNCNPTQKQWFRIVGRYLLANRPADIKKLRETFDPSEEHKEEFLKFITSDD